MDIPTIDNWESIWGKFSAKEWGKVAAIGNEQDFLTPVEIKFAKLMQKWKNVGRTPEDKHTIEAIMSLWDMYIDYNKHGSVDYDWWLETDEDSWKSASREGKTYDFLKPRDRKFAYDMGHQRYALALRPTSAQRPRAQMIWNIYQQHLADKE